MGEPATRRPATGGGRAARRRPRRTRRLAAAALAFIALTLTLARAPAARAALPAPVRAAVDDVLACERPGGGFSYVCAPATGPYGAATALLIHAQAIAEPFGADDWDLLVLRSPGTPAAGLVLLDAYRRGGDARDLEAARRAGDVLLAAQLDSGGWFSEMPVHGARLARWFPLLARWTTLDDDVTCGAAVFLQELWVATGDARYRASAERALDLLLRAQLQNGAFPLTWRAPWIRALRPSFEDLPSTNDAATAGPIRALLAGAALLGRADDLAAARRAGDWLARAQGAPPQSAWAQQYDRDGKPGPGRRFEPAGYAAWESREMLDALLSLASATGDLRYCEPVAAGVLWLLRSAIAPACWARLYSRGANAPLFAGPDGGIVPTVEQARRPYKWTGDYGVPRLLASLGLDPSGAALDPARPLPPPRIFGDAGACPGGTPVELARDDGDPNPRARIARAAVLLGALDPLELSPCAPIVQAALRAAPAAPTHAAAARDPAAASAGAERAPAAPGNRS